MASWVFPVLAFILCSWISGGYANVIPCGQCMGIGNNKMNCPDMRNPERIIVSISDHKDYPQSVLHLLCRSEAKHINFSLIEECDFSAIRYIEFKICPLFNRSFSEVFLQIGINPENVTTLIFYNVGLRQDELQEWHLQGLPNLKNLDFTGNKFTSIPPNLFEATPKLQYFSFTGNNVEMIPESLFKSTPNLTVLRLTENGLTRLPNGIFSDLSKLTNLSLWDNKLVEIHPELLSNFSQLLSLELSHNKISHFDSSVFSSLPNLRQILLNSNSLENLPKDVFHDCPELIHVRIEFNRLKSLPSELFKASKKLQYLNLNNNWITNIPGGIFQGLKDLINIRFNKNALESLPSGVFSDLVNLKLLDLQSNLLSDLPPGCFDNQRNMKTLILHNNSLSELPEEIFKNCQDLEKLYLGFNNISVLHSSAFPHPKSALQILDLQRNNISFSSPRSDLPQASQQITVEEHFPLSGQKSLTELFLNDNKISAVPQAFGTNFPNVTKLNLNGNIIEYLDYRDLSFKSDNLEVNLGKNKIKSVSLQDVDYISSEKVVSVYLEGNPLVCNCDIYQFARLLQRRSFEEMQDIFQLNVLDSGKIKCSYPEQNRQVNVANVNTETLKCKLQECPASCTCFVRSHDKMVIINCAYQGLQAIPKLKSDFLPKENYSITLDLRNNTIRSLKGIQDPEYSALVNLSMPYNKLVFDNDTIFPENLQVLDIRGNNLTTLPKSFLVYLNTTAIVLSLGNNPWLCNCDLVDLHNFLRDPTREVIDSHNIFCNTKEELLIEISEEELCPIFQQPLVIATVSSIIVVLFLFFVLGTVSVYKYKRDIKVWLFTHRLCLWAIAKEEEDANKKYDAFISYSNKDEDFVNTKLVPGLESGDPKYRICLHYRDWVPGEFIQNQIDQSIEASRRTIVILSSNFIENVWGHLEFKTAHSKALKDKTNRIIVIVYGELPPESELDEELKLYLSTRTYLQWGDPKFWEKLRYVMPHPQEFVLKKLKQGKHTDKLELVKSNLKVNT
ncbi:protein toll-like [Homarus americanus]|uniref:Toll-like receptor Toll2-like 1 n=1 Tax=Homarus americanus TaxID=6706 RepID=A0A8J5N691_HOMAM|nr:protein toll-like [Homarus americanus]KAG7174381.1 toll-like receptor Toll2-like 1 [Homarus americanus]